MSGNKSKKSNSSLFKLAIVPIILGVLYPLWRTIQANDPVLFFLPNLLLFTPFRETTRDLWNSLVVIDKTKPIEPRHVPVIEAKDYTVEKLREATENWRYPAIVRGLFKGTAAEKKWPTKDYFPSRTGTGWHCAAGNNWFAQVVGTKRWYFLDPKYSAYMYPLRGGKVNMMTGNKEMGELQKYLPLRYGDVRAGDLLYNPDWEWHTIKNYEGLSIGVPIREVNFTLSMQNNLQYSTIILINKVLEKFNLDIGGYPPAK